MARARAVAPAVSKLLTAEKALAFAATAIRLKPLVRIAVQSGFYAGLVDGGLATAEGLWAMRKGADPEKVKQHVARRAAGGFVTGSVGTACAVAAIGVGGAGLAAMAAGAVGAAAASRAFNHFVPKVSLEVEPEAAAKKKSAKKRGGVRRPRTA